MESIYNFIKKILNQQTAIFFNRHIDQLILCSIYGVAKVCKNFSLNSSSSIPFVLLNTFIHFSVHLYFLQISEVKLSFKEIICNYKKQPYCKAQVFRSVYVNCSSSSRNAVTPFSEKFVDSNLRYLKLIVVAL